MLGREAAHVEARNSAEGRAVAVAAVLVVLAVYVWLVTAGTWTTWRSPTRHYANLARGFLRGQLSVPGRADPRLELMVNPYDPQARKAANINVAIDLSYFQGRYYLYWGPVPAIILAGLSPVVSGRVGDLVLASVFVAGLLFVQAALLTHLWRRYFSNVPRWLLGASIVTAGLAGPAPYLLNSTNAARVYEAAISGGQFFLLGGLLVMAKGLSRRLPSALLLGVAGGLWALAVGTRLLLVVPIGALVLIAAIWSARREGWVRGITRRVLPVAVPLLLAAVALGWYNWARFGSIFETGLRYQFAGQNIYEHYNDIFDPGYIRLNAYNYLLQPLRLADQPPFVFAGYGSDETVLCPATCPPLYRAAPIIGALTGTPFVLFAFAPLVLQFRRRPSASPGAAADGREARAFLHWLEISLGLAALAALLVLLTYWVASLRFMHDFMPALLSLSTLGLWRGYMATGTHRHGRAAYVIVALLLMAASVAVGVLPAASAHSDWYAAVQ